MMNTLMRVLLLLVLLFPATLMAGSKKMPSAQSVCDEIEKEIPGAQFERESHIRLGRVAMALVKPMVRLALDKDDEARAMVNAIKRVDIATYRVVELPNTLDTSVIRHIESRFADRGWNKIVRTREDDDNTWVFSRHRDDGSISGIFVVDLDGYELSIVGVEGRLDEILANAIADEPGEFSSLFGS